MIFVWFVYGLAFFVLGLAILVYPKKGSEFRLARHIWMIGVFGIVHGVNEWLDMFRHQAGLFQRSSSTSRGRSPCRALSSFSFSSGSRSPRRMRAGTACSVCFRWGWRRHGLPFC